MKWLALTAAGVLVAAAVWFVANPGGESPALATPGDAVPVRPARTVPVRAAETPPAPGDIDRHVRLHGLIYQARDAARSQALLAIDGAPGQIYHVGDPVTQGWSVQAIHPQAVELANGSARVRLDVVGAHPATAAAGVQAGAAPMSAPTVSAQPARTEALPGFSPGPAPRALATDGPPRESNRRFLEAARSRLQAAP